MVRGDLVSKIKSKIFSISLIFICIIIVCGVVYLNDSKSLDSNKADNLTIFQENNETIVVHSNQLNYYFLSKIIGAEDNNTVTIMENGKPVELNCTESQVEIVATG